MVVISRIRLHTLQRNSRGVKMITDAVRTEFGFVRDALTAVGAGWLFSDVGGACLHSGDLQGFEARESLVRGWLN